MKAVRCEQLSKAYGDVYAVRDFNMLLTPGEIVALVGPSGCGKTTILRLIAGFVRPDRGSIVIGERPVAASGLHVPPERRQIGMVFQHYALFPHLNVAANVAYGLRGPNKHAQVRTMLELVELTGLETRMPHELSGGQQQRVALARALAPQPAVLLLDEPFSNLDADLRVAMRSQVRDILKRVGTTALFVTHDQEEALFMGDRVGVMRAGQLEQVATPETLFLQPATRFIAEFVGAASFVPASLTPVGLETELGFVPQPVVAQGGEVVDVLIRPDDLALDLDPQGNGRIASRTFRGGDYFYEVTLDSQLTVRCVCNHVSDFAPGTRVRVRLVPGHALAWFPTVTPVVENPLMSSFA